jgi:hypothetical protein
VLITSSLHGSSLSLSLSLIGVPVDLAPYDTSASFEDTYILGGRSLLKAERDGRFSYGMQDDGKFDALLCKLRLSNR